LAESIFRLFPPEMIESSTDCLRIICPPLFILFSGARDKFRAAE
jgi:hypothetical protein